MLPIAHVHEVVVCVLAQAGGARGTEAEQLWGSTAGYRDWLGGVGGQDAARKAPRLQTERRLRLTALIVSPFDGLH